MHMHRGRLPSHTFIDYSLAYLAVAVITSFVGGQLGPSVVDGRPNFLAQMPQIAEHWPLVAFAAGGGACLALGDIAMQACMTAETCLVTDDGCRHQPHEFLMLQSLSARPDLDAKAIISSTGSRCNSRHQSYGMLMQCACK